MRVFLDANVLFSASNSSSHIADLISIIHERHEIVTSDLALEEARRNIEAKRPHWREAFIQLSKNITIVPTRIMVLPVAMVKKDVPIHQRLRTNATTSLQEIKNISVRYMIRRLRALKWCP